MFDRIGRPRGFVTVTGIVGADGKPISTQDAVDKGILVPSGDKSTWGCEKHEVPLGHNLFVDNGRQYLAYVFGGASPLNNYVCSSYGIGTGDPGVYPPNVTDVALIAPISLVSQSGATTKPVDGIDYPAPYIARVQFTIATSDANGYLITELGLFSGDGSLMCRKTSTGINKSSAYQLALSWRIRF